MNRGTFLKVLAAGLVAPKSLRGLVGRDAPGPRPAYGDNDNPVPVQEVMQQILDDFGSGLRVFAESDPGFLITRYEPDFTTWQGGLTQLVDLVGWGWRQEGGKVLLYDRYPGLFVHERHSFEYVDATQ